MTTAVQVAERSLKRILVQADDAPLDASDYADFYDSMNAFMAALEGENCVLGYTPVSDAADVITIPPGAVRGLVANMAVEVAPDYGVSPSPALIQQAQRGLRVMRLLGRPRIETSYPKGLPIGTGNWETDFTTLYGSQVGAELYLSNVAQNLTSEDGTLLTEFTTVDGVEQSYVAGYWKTVSCKGLLCNSRGEIRNTQDTEVTLTVEYSADYVADTTDSYTLTLSASNDTVIGTSADSGTSGEFSITGQVTLKPGAMIQRANIVASSGNALTVYNGRLKVY